MIELIAYIGGASAGIGTMIVIYDRQGGVGTLEFLLSLAIGFGVFALAIYFGRLVFG